jgi:hypothetical protein
MCPNVGHVISQAHHREFAMAAGEMNREEFAAFNRAWMSSAGAKHRKRVRPIPLIHLRRHPLRPPIRSETYESRPIQLRNPKKLICRKFVHTA